MTMVLWNKVSLVSPYIDDVRSSVGEGPIRVWFVRSADLHILAVGVLIRRSWLAFGEAISTSFCLFYRDVRNLQHPVLMVNDCKPMFLANIVSVNFIYRCQQRVVFAVFKVMFRKGVCMCLFSLLSLWCDLQASASSRRSKEDDQFGF